MFSRLDSYNKGLFCKSPVNPAHMVSPAGVVQGRDATPSCLHSTVRLCSATDIMRDCNVGNSGSHTNLRSTLLTDSRQPGFPFCQHAFSYTPRGCASLAPAVAANPNMAIGLYRGSDLNPTQSPVNPAHMVSHAGVVQGGGATPSCLHDTIGISTIIHTRYDSTLPPTL